MQHFATLLALATVAFSNPIPAEEDVNATEATLVARANTLYVCEDINFSGPCQNLVFTPGSCYDLGNGFYKTISSLGPDSATCTIYDGAHCGGASFGGIRNPGYKDLRTIGWNDRIASYRCS